MCMTNISTPLSKKPCLGNIEIVIEINRINLFKCKFCLKYNVGQNNVSRCFNILHE